MDGEDPHSLSKGLPLRPDGQAKRRQPGAGGWPLGLQTVPPRDGGWTGKTARRGSQNRRCLLRKHGGAYRTFSRHRGSQNRKTNLFSLKWLATQRLASFSYRYTPYSLHVSIIPGGFAAAGFSPVAPVQRR